MGDPGGTTAGAPVRPRLRPVRPPVRPSMAQAARIGIVIIAVASLVFLLFDPPFQPNGRVFAAHYAGRVLASLVALALVRRFPSDRHVALILWGLAAVVSASSSWLGTVRGDYSSNALITVAICVGSAAIFPWNWRQHLVLSIIFLAGLMADAAVLGGGLTAAFNLHILLVLVVCLGGATYAVASLGRERRAIDRRQHEDEAEIAALTAELEARVVARTEELHASNDELRKANAELGKANTELQGFTYSVSHDLRGALRVLGGQAHMLLEDHGDAIPADARRLAEQMRAGTIRVGQLVDALLSLARVSRIALRTERVDLTQVANEVGAMLADAEPSRTVKFTVSPGLTALGDPSLMRILLENLLSNAWKFSRRSAEPAVSFDAADTDAHGERVFRVRDNGAGFDMRFANKLFRPFERLHEQADFEGTGIGLATVQRVVLRHGGRAWAEGETGRGAVFSFTLPAPSAADANGAAAAAAS